MMLPAPRQLAQMMLPAPRESGQLAQATPGGSRQGGNIIDAEVISKNNINSKQIDSLSGAIEKFSAINWIKAIIGTKLLKTFSLSLTNTLSKLDLSQSYDVKSLEPLEKIGKATKEFSEINWIRAIIGTKLLHTFASSLTKTMKKIDLSQSYDVKSLEPLEKVGEAIKAFSEIKWVKAIIGTKFLKLFLSSFSKIPAVLIAKAGDSIKKLSETLEKPLKTLGESLSKFGESIGKFIAPMLKAAIAFGIFSLSVIALSYGLKLFAEVKSDSIIKLAATLGVLVVTAKLLGKTSKDMIKGAAAIAILGASVIPLAYGLKLLNNIGTGAVYALIGSLGSLSLAAMTLGKASSSMIKGAAAIAILGASVIPLAYGLNLMSGVDIGTVGVLALALTTLGVAAAVFGSFAPIILTGALAVAALGVALIPLAAGLLIMKDVQVGTIGVLALGLTALGVAAAAFGFIAPLIIAGAIAIGALGLALLPLSAALKSLSSIDPKTLPGLMRPLASFGKDLLSAAPGILLTGAALLPFAAGVTALSLATMIGGESLTGFMSNMANFTEKLDPAKLLATAGALGALAAAVVAFGAAQAAEGLVNLVGKLLRFGSDSPLEQMQKFAAMSDQLKAAGEGVKNLAAGMSVIGKLDEEMVALNGFPWGELEDLAKAISGKSIIQVITGGGSAQGISDISTPTATGNVSGANISSVPSNVGAELAAAGAPSSSAPVIINNNGGNVSNSTSSSVNNTSTPPPPIITGSAMAFM
jgi:hypothetical protein